MQFDTKKFIRVLLFVLLAGCTTGVNLKNVRQTADQAYARGEYSTALAGYEQIIAGYKQQNKTNECPVFGNAGQAALKTGKANKAIEYLEMDTYTPFATGQTYYGLAESFRMIDNLSKEIMALKNFIELFPEGAQIQTIRTRLFETYVESENWHLAQTLWPQLPAEEKSKIEILEKWFLVNRKLENSGECNKLADQLLNTNPDNIAALEYKAENAYWDAENHYQAEMKAYEKNKTNKQYKKLLAELDKVTAEFQIALDFYDKLYALNPKPEYAQYISNIYVRFNNKEKSEYYRKKAGK